MTIIKLDLRPASLNQFHRLAILSKVTAPHRLMVTLLQQLKRELTPAMASKVLPNKLHLANSQAPQLSRDTSRLLHLSQDMQTNLLLRRITRNLRHLLHSLLWDKSHSHLKLMFKVHKQLLPRCKLAMFSPLKLMVRDILSHHPQPRLDLLRTLSSSRLGMFPGLCRRAMGNSTLTAPVLILSNKHSCMAMRTPVVLIHSLHIPLMPHLGLLQNRRPPAERRKLLT